MEKKILLIALLVFIGLPVSFSAKKKVEKIELENITGSATGGETESLQQVKQRAINNAKINALKQAGIKENINTYTDYFQSETDEEYEELFASNIFTNVQGAVKNVEVTDSKRSFTEDGMLQIEVKINCVVLKYLTREDMTFDYWIEGIKPNYDHDERLAFSFKPSADGYLKIFMFTNEEAYQLYPNDYEPSRAFLKNREYEFPTRADDNYSPVREVNYILESEKKSEMHRIVFVFMKADIPYTRKVDYHLIFDWIFSIPPDMREVKTYSFTVFNQEAAK